MSKRLNYWLTKHVPLVHKVTIWNRKRIEKRRNSRQQKLPESFDGKLFVLAIMKNESMVLEEWLHHYIAQGASKIVVIDNGSTDNSVEIAKTFEETGIVECVSRERKWAQREHYWEMLEKYKVSERYEWLLIADLDEFWFVKDGKRLVDVLDHYHESDVIYANMSVFGSNGLDDQPQSVRSSFLMRQEPLGPHKATKYLCRCSCLKNFSQLEVHKFRKVCSSKTISDNAMFQYNHYIIQSKEYFEKVKMDRGDVKNPMHDATRDWSYFEGIDKSCTVFDDSIVRNGMLDKVK